MFLTITPGPSFQLTQTHLTNVTGDITDQLVIILPVAIGVFAVLLGIKLLPRIIKRYL